MVAMNILKDILFDVEFLWMHLLSVAPKNYLIQQWSPFFITVW